MIASDARSALKRRLDIKSSITDFDADIDQFVLDAVKRLSPTLMFEVDPQEVAITVSTYGEATVALGALSTPVTDVREVEVSSGYQAYPVDDKRQFKNSLRLRGLDSSVNKAIIYGRKEYDLASVPSWLELPVIYFALSEFYNFLMANRAKYNVYMQNGRAAVDNMADLVDFYEQKGLDYIQGLGDPVGR